MVGTSTADEHLRYPIGRFAPPGVVTAAQKDAWIDEIERLPADLHASTGPAGGRCGKSSITSRTAT